MKLSSTSQQSLPLALRKQARDELIVTDSNRLACDMLLRDDMFHHITSPYIYLHGSVSSGKSLLAHIWKQHVAAVDVTTMGALNLEDFQAGYYLIDPLDGLITQENTLFHLMNCIKETQSKLLMCSSYDMAALPLQLPDLVSRIRSAHSLHIHDPDDDMLRALLIQQLANKQLKVDATVIEYAIKRMPRMYNAVSELVEQLDILSMQKKQPITISLVKEVMEMPPHIC